VTFYDFNRTGPAMGTDWTILPGGAMTIQSNHVTTGTPAASFALSNAAGTLANVSVGAGRGE
jgi:hypothetical protein